MRSKKTLEMTQLKLLFSRRTSITLPVEKQRDLTAALADLLLNAAAVKSSEAQDTRREVENASKAND